MKEVTFLVVLLIAGCGATPLVPLSWEKSHPERKTWSSQVYGLIRNQLLVEFDSAQDVERFCPNYNALTDDQKANVWSELISAISFYESKWSPTSRMKENTLGIDPVTKQPVFSEGLLQLSYQDVLGYPYCKFDWKQDKALDPNDPRKTILDPGANLDCGTRILANQIKQRGKVVLSSGVYWAVLKEGGRYQKIEKISAMTKQLPFCRPSPTAPRNLRVVP